jgi:DNA-binding FrmR family transcriptional regulator
MDKRAKKKIQSIHQRLQRLRQQLAGVKRLADEPGEVKALEQQIAEAEAQLAKLKGA